MSLDFSDNRLIGGIPPTLGDLRGLVNLNLAQNWLSGPVPQELGKLRGLRELRLQYNELTGSIPPQLEGIFGTDFLRLSKNNPVYPRPGYFRQVADHELYDAFGHDGRPVSLIGYHDEQKAERSLFCRLSGRVLGPLMDDCALLLAIKEDLTGTAKLNWSENLPIRFWQGVSVGGSPRRVVALELPRRELDGRVVEQLGDPEPAGGRWTFAATGWSDPFPRRLED